MTSDEPVWLVAEQTAVHCAPADVEDLLCAPADRYLLAVLCLAGDTGEAAGLLVLGDPSPPSRGRDHTLAATSVEHAERSVAVPFEWRTRGYLTLFEALRGQITGRPSAHGAVLGVEGVYVLAADLAARPSGPAAGRRAAEVAVRTWLAQLRAALEHPPAAPAGAGSGRGDGHERQ